MSRILLSKFSKARNVSAKQLLKPSIFCFCMCRIVRKRGWQPTYIYSRWINVKQYTYFITFTVSYTVIISLYFFPVIHCSIRLDCVKQ